MRTLVAVALAAVLAGLAAGCGGGNGGSAAGTTTTQSCATDQLPLANDGQLTIATDNPAYPPWFDGGAPKGSTWKTNDPSNGKGYESAVAYAVARQLGFQRSDVEWVAVPFAQTYKPGPKDFDFAIEQISYNPQRAKAVTFSRPYFQLNQALVSVEGSSLANAQSVEEVKQGQLGVVIGTTSYQYIVDNIKPAKQPKVYDTLNDNLTALKNGQIDGLVTDFPTAYYMANVQLDDGVLVGRFPTRGPTEYFGLVFEKDNSLVHCVNLALGALRRNGTLGRIEQQWITSKADAPLIQ